MIIYKTTNLINQKFYIGKDTHNNPNYYGSGKRLKLAIKKYGIENFKKEIIEICDNLELLNERERFWIKESNAINEGYNISLGGDGGDTISNNPRKNEIGKKISESNKGRFIGKINSKETREKISKALKGRFVGSKNPNYGKKYSNEVKDKIRKKALGRIVSDGTRKKISIKNKGRKGVVWTNDMRQKMSEYRKNNNPFKGKTHTPEVRALLSKINKKPKSEEHKRKISERLKGNKPGNMRKVIVDGIEYESLSYAARQIGVPTSTMKNRLKSKKFDNYKYKD
jgi:group I intron endonuclease